MAALVLLVPKRARAFVMHIAQQAPRIAMQLSHFGGAMTVTAVCGALVPSGSSGVTDPPTTLGLTQYSTPQATMAQPASLPPDFFPEVEPEEPKALDAETNSWSAADMKSTKFAGYLHGIAVPFAFLVAPALSQVACAGTEQQTPPARQPEDEPDGTTDPYVIACENERRRGNECPSKEEWEKW